MAQEIGLVPEDPNYFNPFRAPAQKEEVRIIVQLLDGYIHK